MLKLHGVNLLRTVWAASVCSAYWSHASRADGGAPCTVYTNASTWSNLAPTQLLLLAPALSLPLLLLRGNDGTGPLAPRVERRSTMLE